MFPNQNYVFQICTFKNECCLRYSFKMLLMLFLYPHPIPEKIKIGIISSKFYIYSFYGHVSAYTYIYTCHTQVVFDINYL